MKNVRSLPPGSILQVKLGEPVTVTKFCSRIKYDGPLPQGMDEAGEILLELLRAEVSRLSIADVNVCSVNSGGLDSSLITALMHRSTSNSPTSFHVACTGNWPFDERHFARELATMYGSNHIESLIEPNDLPNLIPKMVSHLGQPNCAPHALSTYHLFRHVSSEGFRVALTGEGSDELFGGHERMNLALFDNTENWISSYLDRISPCPEGDRLRIYSAEYTNELRKSGSTAKEQMANQLRNAHGNLSRKIRDFEQQVSLPHYILHRVEPLAMASGVEVRVPFCQPRIRDFASKIGASLVSEMCFKDKAVVYRAAQSLVPVSILNRPKQPFTLPVASLMHKGSPLLNFVTDTLSSRSLLDSKLFNPAELRRLIQVQEVTPSKQSAFTLWALTIFAVWSESIKKAAKSPDKTAAEFAPMNIDPVNNFEIVIQ